MVHELTVEYARPSKQAEESASWWDAWVPGELPVELQYDLSEMEGSFEVSFPKRLGGFSISRSHKGINGSLVLRIEESAEPGKLAVSLLKLDVAVGHIELPVPLGGQKRVSLEMVSLGLHASDGGVPTGLVDVHTGALTPLEVALEVKSPSALRSLGGPALVRLTLNERIEKATGRLIGSGRGVIAGGILTGATLLFAHIKPPPIPIPPATTFCVYIVVRGFHGLAPPMGPGDIICVDCPPSGVCPGPGGIDFTISIRDAAGTEAEGMVRNQAGAACGVCPAGGMKGYTFV